MAMAMELTVVFLLKNSFVEKQRWRELLLF